MSTTIVDGWYDITDPAYGLSDGGFWSTAINNALYAATSAGGGVVYFPPRSYDVNASIHPIGRRIVFTVDSLPPIRASSSSRRRVIPATAEREITGASSRERLRTMRAMH
jgi:hypothetical protein